MQKMLWYIESLYEPCCREIVPKTLHPSTTSAEKNKMLMPYHPIGDLLQPGRFVSLTIDLQRVQNIFLENAEICRLFGRGSFVWQATLKKSYFQYSIQYSKKIHLNAVT
jgi:hypothetical protein